LQSITPSPAQATTLPTNPLALKDIHLPEQITNYPIAYGWWILASLVLLIIVIAIIKLKKSAKRNQVKKQALTQLNNNAEMNNSELTSLLKWAAMHYFSRAEVAQLYGNLLHQFLLKKLPDKHHHNFSKLSEQAFNNQYQASFQNDVDKNFQQAVSLWLTNALPPKAIIQIQPPVTDDNIITSSQKQNEGVSS
jgi:hypothetical protein